MLLSTYARGKLDWAMCRTKPRGFCTTWLLSIGGSRATLTRWLSVPAVLYTSRLGTDWLLLQTRCTNVYFQALLFSWMYVPWCIFSELNAFFIFNAVLYCVFLEFCLMKESHGDPKHLEQRDLLRNYTKTFDNVQYTCMNAFWMYLK